MFKIAVTIIQPLGTSGVRELGHKAYKHFCIHYFWMQLCEKWENWAHEVNTKRGRTTREIQHRMEEVLPTKFIQIAVHWRVKFSIKWM